MEPKPHFRRGVMRRPRRADSRYERGTSGRQVKTSVMQHASLNRLLSSQIQTALLLPTCKTMETQTKLPIAKATEKPA
jgi:hypothetical protein